MLDKDKILEAALDGITAYVTRYNDENDAMVAVGLGEPEESDFGCINIDGGHQHGAWTLGLMEL